jgi:hypothetical protein
VRRPRVTDPVAIHSLQPPPAARSVMRSGPSRWVLSGPAHPRAPGSRSDSWSIRTESTR